MKINKTIHKKNVDIKGYLSNDLHEEIAKSSLKNVFDDLEISIFIDLDIAIMDAINENSLVFHEKSIDGKLLARALYENLPDIFKNKINKTYINNICDDVALDHEYNVNEYEDNREFWEKEKARKIRKDNFKKSLTPQQLADMEELFENEE